MLDWFKQTPRVDEAPQSAQPPHSPPSSVQSFTNPNSFKSSVHEASDLASWLESVKPGYASRFLPAFAAVGVEDYLDLANIDQDIYSEIEEELTERCGARKMQLKNIHTALLDAGMHDSITLDYGQQASPQPPPQPPPQPLPPPPPSAFPASVRGSGRVLRTASHSKLHRASSARSVRLGGTPPSTASGSSSGHRSARLVPSAAASAASAPRMAGAAGPRPSTCPAARRRPRSISKLLGSLRWSPGQQGQGQQGQQVQQQRPPPRLSSCIARPGNSSSNCYMPSSPQHGSLRHLRLGRRTLSSR